MLHVSFFSTLANNKFQLWSIIEILEGGSWSWKFHIVLNFFQAGWYHKATLDGYRLYSYDSLTHRVIRAQGPREAWWREGLRRQGEGELSKLTWTALGAAHASPCRMEEQHMAPRGLWSRRAVLVAFPRWNFWQRRERSRPANIQHLVFCVYIWGEIEETPWFIYCNL